MKQNHHHAHRTLNDALSNRKFIQEGFASLVSQILVFLVLNRSGVEVPDSLLNFGQDGTQGAVERLRLLEDLLKSK
ncbi:MAG: hypothetical protein HUU52_06635 [Armatimonadetes bacterium]|nr:hypothetical protein [Armatimonadota bacterium]